MNIYTQVCGLVIILMIIIFYLRQPRMGLNSEKRFGATLFIIMLCVIFDIVSCYFIVYSNKYSELLVLSVCKLYLISLHAVAFSALSYTVSDIFENLGSKLEKTIGIVYQGIFVIGILMTLNYPIRIYYDGLKLYSYDKAAICTYVFVAFYITSIIVATILLKSYIKPKKINALLLWMSLWIIAAVIQFLHPSLLIVSFASCVGALIMYFELENPQAAISRKTGHFSSAVIQDYFDHMYQSSKKFSILMISFKNTIESANDRKLLRKSTETLSDFLFNIDSAKVFDTVEGNFLLVFENTDFLESTKFKISTYFQSIESDKNIANAVSLVPPTYTSIPDCSIFESSDELMQLITSYLPHDNNTTITNDIEINLDMMTEVKQHKQIEHMVVDAMESDRIEMHYQPIYNIKTEKFTSAEALVRIKRADGTYVYPSEFIPVVEETGRIIPLSDTIYEKTLSFIKSYHIERLGIKHIELNLSVKQGESPVFTTKLLELLDNYDIDPSIINLEITETHCISSKDNLYSNMKKLKEYGLSFSLDDFGSGSSNLNYIVDMPVNIVKLDKHLTQEYFTNPKAKAIVQATIKMAHTMDIKIIAEGIETVNEFKEMKELDVDYIQGFFFSKPLPEHEFLRFIQTHNL